MNQSFFLAQFLSPEGWQSNSRIILDDKGVISEIILNTEPEESDRIITGYVIPAMQNCHSHAFQRAIAGMTEYNFRGQDSFWSWRDLMYRFVDKLTPEDCHIIAKQLYIEMLKSGYVGVGEFHYLHHDSGGQAYADVAEMSHAVISAAQEVGMRMTLLPVLYRYSGFGEQPPNEGQRRFIMTTDQYLDYHDQIKRHYASHDLVVGSAPHSLRAVSVNDLHQLTKTLEPDAPFHIHIAEQLAEVEQCLAHCHLRPVEHLYDNLEPQHNWTLIHATHLNSMEISQIIDSKAIVGICPTTEANLGDGVFNPSALEDPLLRWAIGSDSHISVNVWEELRWLEYTQRLTRHARAVNNSEQTPSVGTYLWQQAAKQGADSLGVKSGEIDLGNRADWLVLDSEHVKFAALKVEQILDSAVFSVRENEVIKQVFVAGHQCIEEGHHPEEDRVAEAFRVVMQRLVD